VTPLSLICIIMSPLLLQFPAMLPLCAFPFLAVGDLYAIYRSGNINVCSWCCDSLPKVWLGHIHAV
jgi:hypothetical protein